MHNHFKKGQCNEVFRPQLFANHSLLEPCMIFRLNYFPIWFRILRFRRDFCMLSLEPFFWVKIILNRKLFKTNVSTNTKCRELHVLSIIFLPDIQSHRWIQFNKKWRTQTSWHCLFNLPM